MNPFRICYVFFVFSPLVEGVERGSVLPRLTTGRDEEHDKEINNVFPLKEKKENKRFNGCFDWFCVSKYLLNRTYLICI